MSSIAARVEERSTAQASKEVDVDELFCCFLGEPGAFGLCDAHAVVLAGPLLLCSVGLLAMMLPASAHALASL